MRRATAIVWTLTAALVAAAGGVAVGVAGDREVLYGVGMGLIGVGIVLLLSLAFYAVGRSEDREREREEERRRARLGRRPAGRGRRPRRPPRARGDE
jgi:hypothetical protein